MATPVRLGRSSIFSFLPSLGKGRRRPDVRVTRRFRVNDTIFRESNVAERH